MSTDLQGKGDANGFTLIELLVVLAVIAIISTIAIPNLLNAIDRSKQTRTMADLRSIGTAIEQYSVENSFYPVVSTLAALSDQVTPAYIREVPSTDGWGNSFSIDSSTAVYTVASCGKGATGGCTPVCTGSCGTSQNYTDDIIYSVGAFVQWPEGKQE
jgi:type II secretion system protein G